MEPNPPARRKSGRPKGAPTDNQQQRRALILGQAAALFAELGYAASTMDELAERTDLNKGTLYYYYKSKSDLLYELALGANQQAVAIAEASGAQESAVDQLSNFIEKMVSWVYANRNIAVIFIKEQSFFIRVLDTEQFAVVSRTHRSYMRLLYGMISEGVESGAFRRCDVVTIGRAVSTILFSIATWRSTSLTEAAVAEQMKLLFLDGLTSAALSPVAGSGAAPLGT
ncbi:MAG: TetR/AcrR family transcriptional regulator [Phenylobacterium sp.]|uniref:TetR/AcrR family transcriptional regulator n=1 Tax=Phenylobacterium sp. TaxID=1871053 RepID=UPI002737371D|nr:TetR/AcrR family transcriptional regulator [Phenylobacterium sp.]MDP3750010.1 TetR/AcrR family transcriptional regulator [Phenylobacterium sp.]